MASGETGATAAADEESCNAVKKARREPAGPPATDAPDAAWRSWAELWASWDPNPATRAVVLDHLATGNVEELRRLLSARLEFGTAGLRGPMGAGSSRMNDLVVLQTTQGVCVHLEETLGVEEAHRRGVCVGFDHRARQGCDSRSFARHVAAVLLHRGFHVYFYDDFVATPLVPWCIEHRGCCAGVMVTASHNPADDNGYKLYWGNGAQIIPPHDERIAVLIEGNLEPWSKYETAAALEGPRFHPLSLDGDVVNAYFERLRSLCHFAEVNQALSAGFPITYTAMHGVGFPFVKRSFAAFGHSQGSLVGTTAQLQPDPAFPTVAFPNPEEGKGALQLAFDAALAAGSRLVLANDPDADRLAVAERTPAGSWHVFTGNELGSLLGHWAWSCWRRQHPTADASKVYMIASTVSSKFLASVAEKEGFHFVETLTGFKWMGSKAAELRQKGFEVIFAFEEAIGFCFGDVVKDKDGVAAAAVFAEMAKQLSKDGRTCLSHLHDLYSTYGHFLSLNTYLKCADPALTRRIFELQRGGAGGRSYPTAVGEFAVTAVRDLTEGHDSRTKDLQPELPLNKGGEMITYYFGALSAQVTLRTSGTEPKIKVYSELRCQGVVEEGRERLARLVRAAVLQLLDPIGNGLELRAEDRELFAV